MSTLQELSFNHLFNLPSKALKKLPEFKRNQSNQMSSNVRAQMMIQVAAGCDPVKCGCEPVNGFKCIDETCLNRVAGVECSEECKCLNGPAARVVTDAVEIVSVPFGGFGLQTVKPILKVCFWRNSLMVFDWKKFDFTNTLLGTPDWRVHRHNNRHRKDKSFAGEA